MNETFAIVDGKLVMKPSEDETVNLEAARVGVLGGFAKTEFMGVPIGAAGVGLLTVSVWDALRGLLGGMLPAAIPAWLVPAIGAMVVQSRMIKGWMGADAANAAGLILTADAIQALFNVRGLVSNLTKGIRLGQTMKGYTAGGDGSKEITSIEQYNLVHGLN